MIPIPEMDELVTFTQWVLEGKCLASHSLSPFDMVSYTWVVSTVLVSENISFLTITRFLALALYRIVTRRYNKQKICKEPSSYLRLKEMYGEFLLPKNVKNEPFRNHRAFVGHRWFGTFKATNIHASSFLCGSSGAQSRFIRSHWISGPYKRCHFCRRVLFWK